MSVWSVILSPDFLFTSIRVMTPILFAALAGCIALFGGEGIWWAPTVSEAVCLGITLLFVRGMAGREERERIEDGIPAEPASLEAGKTGGAVKRKLPG